jgi:UDP-N-acetylglucosamine 2-epimerase (non-hydrolysing)
MSGLKNKKIAIVLGTRPEIIKLSPIIRYCQNNKLNYFIIHTNQHYSDNMDKLFFYELELPNPKYNLCIGSATPAVQIGKILENIEPILIKEKPDIVLVQGDTNSVLAGALAASKLNIKVGHVEAGLRSFDRTMPEETNRVITDHISNYLFCPTKESVKYLKQEGITKNVFLVGNTISEALSQNYVIALEKSKILKKLNIEKERYLLLTFHRQENVDNRFKLNNVINGIFSITKFLNMPCIWPIHPRSQKMLAEFKIEIPSSIKTIDPVGYLDFLILENNANLILTDSGGIQEEVCILKKKCITLRENTERPETVKMGCNILAGTDSNKILTSAKKILIKKVIYTNPYIIDKKSTTELIINKLK